MTLSSPRHNINSPKPSSQEAQGPPKSKHKLQMLTNNCKIQPEGIHVILMQLRTCFLCQLWPLALLTRSIPQPGGGVWQSDSCGGNDRAIKSRRRSESPLVCTHGLDALWDTLCNCFVKRVNLDLVIISKACRGP